MARAVLEIIGESSSITRMFGEIANTSRRTAAAVSSDWRNVRRSVTGDSVAIAQAMARAALAAVRADERAAARRQAVERRVSEVASVEGNYRTNARRREGDEGEAAANRMRQAYERSERGATETTRRESRTRIAALRAEAEARSGVPRGRSGLGGGGEGGSGGGSGGGAARTAWRGVQAVSSAYQATIGQTGSALEQYADIEHTMNAALRQTTSDPREIADSRQQMMQFAVDYNLDPAQVAQAAAGAQEHFSALGDRTMTRAQRGDRMRSFQANLLEAANTGQDLGAYSELAGALASQGLDDGAQRNIMRSLTGIGQRGSVDLSDLLHGGGLRGMMAAVARAAPGGADAVQAAITEQVSALEVLAPAGVTPTSGSNSLNNMAAALGNQRTQDALRAHIRNRFGEHSTQEQQLFQDDGHGHSSLRGQYRNALTLGETLGTMTGNDRDAVANLLGTETDRHGHVLRQVLRDPQRNALAALTSADMSGKTGYERLHDIQNGAALTEDDVAAGAALRGSELITRIQRDRNNAMVALAGDARLTGQAERQRAFAAEHPFLNNALDQLPGGGGDMVRQIIGERDARVTDQAPLAGIRLAPNTSVELGPNTVAALRPSAHDLVHAANVSATNAGTREGR